MYYTNTTHVYQHVNTDTHIAFSMIRRVNKVETLLRVQVTRGIKNFPRILIYVYINRVSHKKSQLSRILSYS